MYINIDHIVKYTRSLNWLISAIFLCAIVVMSIIGYRLGVKIEESQKTQRRFFQNSSHELKTPLMAIQGYAEGIEMDVDISAKCRRHNYAGNRENDRSC